MAINKKGINVRGYKKYYHTVKDIASVLSVTPDRIRHLISKKEINPHSLDSIIKYYVKKRVNNIKGY